MTPRALDRYRDRLLQLIGRHREELARLRGEAAHGVGGESGGGISNLPTHQADLGTAHHEQEVGILLEENQAQLLAACEAALARLDAGTYGRCERCGCEIPAGRLEAFPSARYCLSCAEVVEPGIASP